MKFVMGMLLISSLASAEVLKTNSLKKPMTDEQIRAALQKIAIQKRTVSVAESPNKPIKKQFEFKPIMSQSSRSANFVAYDYLYVDKFNRNKVNIDKLDYRTDIYACAKALGLPKESSGRENGPIFVRRGGAGENASDMFVYEEYDKGNSVSVCPPHRVKSDKDSLEYKFNEPKKSHYYPESVAGVPSKASSISVIAQNIEQTAGEPVKSTTGVCQDFLTKESKEALANALINRVNYMKLELGHAQHCKSALSRARAYDTPEERNLAEEICGELKDPEAKITDIESKAKSSDGACKGFEQVANKLSALKPSGSHRGTPSDAPKALEH